jgi:hypothetical protein
MLKFARSTFTSSGTRIKQDLYRPSFTFQVFAHNKFGSPQWPIRRGRSLKVEYLDKLESTFKTALEYKAETWRVLFRKKQEVRNLKLLYLEKIAQD